MSSESTDGASLDERARLEYTKLTILPLRDMAAKAGDEFVAYSLEIVVSYIVERLQELEAEASLAAGSE